MFGWGKGDAVILCGFNRMLVGWWFNINREVFSLWAVIVGTFIYKKMFAIN